MSDTLTLAPLVAWPVITALAALAALLAGFAIVRRARGALLRTLALAVLLAALLEPRLIREQRERQPDLAVVVVDATPSQSVGNRTAAAAEALAGLQDSLAAQPNLENRVITIGGGPAETATRLFSALEKAGLADDAHRLAGVVLLTDGQVHDAPGADLPRWLQAPVHVLLTGAPGERDRRVVIEHAPAYGLVGRTVDIAFRVDDLGPRPVAGSVDAGPVAVSVRSDGTAAGTVSVMPGQSQVLPVVLAHAGPVAVELSAAADEGEVSLRNNRAAIVINAVRERLKVLLVSGQPHPGARAWRNLLKSDPAVDLVHFTILRSAEKDEGAPLKELALIVFPVQELFEDRLKDFDLIVFDRFTQRDILPAAYFDNMAAYVRNGGAMLIASGPEFADPQGMAETGLKDILPARPTGRIVERPFTAELSEAGRRHPVTQPLATTAAPATAPAPGWGRWFRLIEANAPAGVTLMTGPDAAPLVVLGRVAEGRIAQVLSDQIWLWARGYDGGGPHAELTRRLVHWLMREPALEEERLSAAVSDGRLVVERHSLSANAATVEVTLPDGRRLPLALTEGADGLARGSLAADEPGLYRVADGSHEAIAVAGRINADETIDLRATPDRLQATAAASGGWLGWLADGLPDVRRTGTGRDTHGKGWLGLRRTGAEVVRGVTEVPLLPPLAALGLGLALLAAAWWREGR